MRKLPAFATAALFFAASALADGPMLGLPEWISGKAIFDQHESIGPARNEREPSTLQSGLSLYTIATPRFSENLSGKAALRGSAFRRSLEDGRAHVLRGNVQEAWIARDAGGVEVRFGQIVTPWGKSDAVNPTDLLTAKDLTLLSSHDEIRRKGAPGLRASFTPADGAAPVEVSFAYSARYPQTEMLIPRASVPAGIAVEIEPRSPDFFGDRQEWAMKVAYFGSAADASIMAFEGRSHFGQFVWDGSTVRLSYEKMRALGGDFSVTFDQFVLRGEAAYFFYEAGKRGRGSAALTEPNHLDAVLGVERAFGERFRMILQGLYRVHPSLRDPAAYVGANALDTAVGRQVGRANALIQNYQEKSETGATLLAVYSAESGWTYEIGALGNFIGGDFVLRPKIRYKLGDFGGAAAVLTTGLDYYGGPVEKTLGALRDYRSAYVDLTVSF